MNHYRNILVAVDISNAAYLVTERAQSVAQHHGSDIHIIHVLEPIMFAYQSDLLLDMANIQTELENKAKKHLQKIAAQFYIPEPNQHLILGSAAPEIHGLANRLNIDLIVIGTHGRGGLALLLGSSASKVLHSINCDLLAVRLGKN